MNRFLSLSAIALVATIGLAACSAANAGAPATPSVPVVTPAPPTASPTISVPTTTPTTPATPAPSAGPRHVALETTTGHDVSIEILDESGRVVGARSGQPGDGASVAFGTVVATNVDAKTIKLTWSDTPGDAELGLYVSEAANVVLVIRPEREEGDAIAFDRVLIVEFDSPVDAASLTLGVQEGLDTAG